MFNLTSRVAQLRRLVDILGTPKDTIEHRHKIADINASIQQVRRFEATKRAGMCCCSPGAMHPSCTGSVQSSTDGHVP